MPPLTLDDLIPLGEYFAERSQHAAAQARYLDRYRRVRIAAQLTLTFENRQTLWFRVQEMLRVARLDDPRLIQQELDLYNRLLPTQGCLQAALRFEIDEGPHWAEQMTAWRSLSESAIRLVAGDASAGCRFITVRPEDACFGVAHWVEFSIGRELRSALADWRTTATISADFLGRRHQSGPLTEHLRQSLLDDLALSDRDVAA